ERRGADTVAAAVQWLQGAGSRPSFCWVHLYEPHAPYVPPEPFASRHPGAPYVGEVEAADAALEPLLRPLLESASPHTRGVIAGAHGERLGEPGARTHGLFACESTLHVPLVMFAPGVLPEAGVDAVVGHSDILPTVLDVLGLPTPGDLPGRSLVALSTGARPPARPLYFQALSAAANRGWAPLTAALRGSDTYVELALPALDVLVSAPREVANVVAGRPREVERFQADLRLCPSAEVTSARASEDREPRDALRSLGYLASSTPPRKHYGIEDDPKRLVG